MLINMPATNILEKLGTAEVHLDQAIRSLLEMNSPADKCPLSLHKAADVLSSVHLARDAGTPRTRLEPLLQSIAVKAATARRLLESAASFYFGAVLHHGSLEQGYGASGIADKFGGGCLRVEG